MRTSFAKPDLVSFNPVLCAKYVQASSFKIQCPASNVQCGHFIQKQMIDWKVFGCYKCKMWLQNVNIWTWSTWICRHVFRHGCLKCLLKIITIIGCKQKLFAFGVLHNVCKIRWWWFILSILRNHNNAFQYNNVLWPNCIILSRN